MCDGSGRACGGNEERGGQNPECPVAQRFSHASVGPWNMTLTTRTAPFLTHKHCRERQADPKSSQPQDRVCRAPSIVGDQALADDRNNNGPVPEPAIISASASP